MVDRFIRIGAVEDAAGYDDADFDSAIETDQPIKAGTPIDSNDVTRLEDIESKLLPPESVTNLANPTELNSVAGTAGALILAYQVVGASGLNEYTIYAYDSDGPAVNSPYIVDASGGGSERWIAIAGKYSAIDFYLNQLTASRLVASNASKALISSDISNWIDGTANEITVTDDGDGTVTLEGAGSDTDFTVVTAIQAGGAGAVGFQYKTRDLTLNGGIISTVGAESAWNDV